MSQLRLRNSSPGDKRAGVSSNNGHHHDGNGDSKIKSSPPSNNSSSSFEDLSIHTAIPNATPTLQQTTPSMRHLTINPSYSSGSPLRRLTRIPVQRLTRQSITQQRSRRVKLSTLFLCGIIFAIGFIQTIHYLLAASSINSYDAGGMRGTSYVNAPQRTNQRYHSRIIDISNLPLSIQSASKFNIPWTSIILPRLWKREVNDPMLHNDSWQPPSYFVKEEPPMIIDNSVVEEEEPQCIPMAKWQTTSYPNCNSIHEIDLVRSSGSGSYTFPNDKSDILLDNNNIHEQYTYNRRAITTHPEMLHKVLQKIMDRYPSENRKINQKSNARGIIQEESINFLGQGWFRGAWEMYTENIPEYDEDEEEWGYEESVVLKTLRIERDFLEEYYELHRRDALAMERLTFSPYVLDIYGYCGQSAINELANFGIEGMSSLEKVARSFRGMQHIEPVSKIKLQLASMVATGISHMHSIDHPDFPQRYDSDDNPNPNFEEGLKMKPNATLVHYDLNPRNIAIVKRGKPKLNDFNVAEFLTWDRIHNKTCGFQGRFKEPWWRAPEEMQAHLPDEYPNPAPLTEKIDVFSLGNILWDILTTHSPYKMSKDKMDRTRVNVAKGVLPDWPDDFNKTKAESDPALNAIEKAMQKCLRTKPEDRPTAGEIADELSEALEHLPDGFGDKEAWRQKMEANGCLSPNGQMKMNKECQGDNYVDAKADKKKK